MSTLRILHCFGDLQDFAAENLPERLEKLGGNLHHELVGVAPEHWQSTLKPVFKSDFPALSGKPMPGRLLSLANAIKPYDLVLTYGWGAIDVAMAHTLFSDALGLPPLVHHETALTGEEKRLSKRRTWYRRIALGKAAGLVVPNEKLEEIALINWQQPLGRVKLFQPAISITSVDQETRPDAITGVIKRGGEKWIGMQISDHRELQTGLELVEAMADLSNAWHLVVLRGATDAEALNVRAEEKDVAHRVHLAASPNDIARTMGLFDIWAALSDTPAAQRLTLTAMAGCKPVLAQEGGAPMALLAEENRGHLAKSGSAFDLGQALNGLAGNGGLRARIGSANQERAKAKHDMRAAIERYRRLYASAMKAEIKP